MLLSMLPAAAVLGVPLLAQLCWGVPYSRRLSFCNTFSKRILNTYYVHQLYKSMEYTDLLLKGHTVSKEDRHEDIIMLCGEGWGIDDRGMPSGLQLTG